MSTIDLDDKVAPIGVKYREQEASERVLTVVDGLKCVHRRFTVDKTLAQVTCRDCNEKLDPMYVLTQIAYGETKYHDLHARYQDELTRLRERSKTKCEHCQKMTTISRR